MAAPIDHYDRAQSLLQQLAPEQLRIRRPHEEATIAVGHALLAIANELRRLRNEVDSRPERPGTE